MHHLDLSNPALSTTINTTFKPLELLIRFLNQPSNKQPTTQQAADTAVPEDANQVCCILLNDFQNPYLPPSHFTTPSSLHAPTSHTFLNTPPPQVHENTQNSLLDRLLLQTSPEQDVVTISSQYSMLLLPIFAILIVSSFHSSYFSFCIIRLFIISTFSFCLSK